MYDEKRNKTRETRDTRHKHCSRLLQRPRGVDVKVDTQELEDWIDVARRVKEVVLRLKPTADVYVFGSVMEDRFTGAGDIDILVAVDNLEERYDVVT